MESYKATGYFLDRFKARSWYECMALCLRYIGCNGINWEKTQSGVKTQTCDLLYVNSETVYAHDTAYNFYKTE